MRGRDAGRCMTIAGCIPAQSTKAPGVGQLQAQLQDALRGNGSVQVLRERHDSQTLRMSVDAMPVVVKLWKRPGLRGAIRRLTGTNNASREYRALCELGAAGVSVPKAIAICDLKDVRIAFTDALFVEDLGDRPMAMTYLKEKRKAGFEQACTTFEEQVLVMTRQIVRAGFVDPDHGFHNLLASEEGQPVRIDFEVAVKTPGVAMVPGLYGQMLGRLLTTYTFT